MKYRSFNEELLIATALLINVFNDIVIDRRKHGLKKDFSKPISLKDIAQQEIEIPCILGDRSHILRSLENEAGKYKLPLIILSNKSIKTDTTRMVDIHSDVFYQQDSQFFDLDPQDPHYKPQQIGKRRAQPVNMEFDMTILTKYKEDMDQILSNWIVFFKPDVYVKWWSPRRENETINSQILWNHSISHELPIEFNPTNVFTYKSSTSFTFKTWLFPGMYNTEHKIDPDTENVIKKFKFYPNRGDWWDEEDLESGQKDANFEDESYVFGDIYENEVKEPVLDPETGEYINPDNGNVYDPNVGGFVDPETGEITYTEYDPDDLYRIEKIPVTNEGQMGFWGVSTSQEFYNDGSDSEGLKSGKYMVNNVFAHNYPEISGHPQLSKIKYNTLFGDIFSNYDKNLINSWDQFNKFLTIGPIQDMIGTAFIKNVYFKGGFPEGSGYSNTSGDFLYKHFYSSYIKNPGKSNERVVNAEFGDSFINEMQMNLTYNIDSKNLSLTASFNDNNYLVESTSIFNSSKGIYQKLLLENITNNERKKIKFNFERSCDNNFEIIKDKTKNQTKNVILFNKLIEGREIRFDIETPQFKDISRKLLNVLNVYKNSIDLTEIDPGQFEMVFNESKIGSILNSKGLLNVPFKTFSLAYQTFINGYQYQVLLNKKIYLVIKSSTYNEDDVSIYDIGILAPLKFEIDHAPLFEITIPESKMLLGFVFDMEI